MKAKHHVKRFLTWHVQGKKAPVFLFATPRGGSTWLAEAIRSQPRMRFVAEPLNLRIPEVAKSLGFSDWKHMYDEGSTEAFRRYFTGLLSGELRFVDAIPLKAWRKIGFRFLTDRVSFKIIHGGSDRIDWFCETFGGSSVLLIRHPIATAVSREFFPFLERFRESEYRKRFSDGQNWLAEEILDRGDKIEKGVLAWCLYNFVPLTEVSRHTLVVTYEQLLLQPEIVLRAVAEHCDLPDADRMLAGIYSPSTTSRKSDPKTRELLRDKDLHARNTALLSKWRKAIPAERETQLLGICEAFGIEAYHGGSLLPLASRWIGAAYPASTNSPERSPLP